MRFRASDRDAGLRRVSSLTRWLVAGGVGLVGVLSAVVAQALPGTSGAATTPTAVPSAGATPTPATVAPAPTSPTTIDPSLNAPSLQPVPAPVPTQHHHVASSGGS